MARHPQLRSGGEVGLTSVIVALVVLVAALTTSLGIPAGAQTEPDGATPSEAAATWLAGQLVDGERLQVTFGPDSFDDAGLTVDAVIAFAAAGVADGAAGDATAWLERSATTSSYVGDGTVESYAGALAKLSLLAQVRGLDPTDWGADGVDLLGRLQAQEQPGGRFVDVSDFGDFSNSIGQSLAVIALTRQPGVAASDASIDLLLLSQCADGGFSLALEPVPADCESGVDTTAFALQALMLAGRAADLDDVLDGIGYLQGVQGSGGGFGTDAVEAPNANSTGLATQALRVFGDDASADAGAAHLASLQVGCASPSEVGAVAFDASGFDAGTAPRATAQAILGLTGAGFGAVISSGASTDLPELDCTTSTTPTTQLTGLPVVPRPGMTAPAKVSSAAVPVVAKPAFTG